MSGGESGAGAEGAKSGAGGAGAEGPGSREPVGGRTLAGRYRLLDPLGEGSSGIVWRARDELLGREVAVREVRAPAGLDAEGVRRVHEAAEREAGAAARIAHRGVVRVHDVASEDGRPWIVMELVRGLTLAEVLAGDGPLPPGRAAHIGEQLLAALRAAHDAGVLHRDVRPGNVLVANDGRVMLSDFGLPRPDGPAGAYLAPELESGREPTPEADLWSLGALLWTAVEGSPPPRPVPGGEAAAPRRAGTLAPVLEVLLHADPARRATPAQAARMLRVVGAGGTVRASGGPESGPAGIPAASAGESGADGAGGGTATAAPPEGAVPRRAGLVLAAGVLVLLVGLVALVWLLASA
ncbi:serine/threonine-protein kinase [Streptomyces sp. NPDC012888]|uniref:serine/threonine-protein kinase n=1 Tax=Streptomyces sp. NPDC012888 TaxID=3364855 RepID=UPI0036BFEFF6